VYGTNKQRRNSIRVCVCVRVCSRVEISELEERETTSGEHFGRVADAVYTDDGCNGVGSVRECSSPSDVICMLYVDYVLVAHYWKLRFVPPHSRAAELRISSKKETITHALLQQ
jgi:hypothetical protein